ncbi:FmdE family protein [Haladaptatus sp. NG-SE-30]
MSKPTNETTGTKESTNESTGTNWQIDYEAVEPIRIRDPVAEALTVLEPGDPFVVSYEDVVKAAGHSCPTAAGAYRIAQLGLDALYPDDLPVRGDVEVTAGGPVDDPSYGVMSRLISYVTGAAREDGFGGLAGGYGGRKNFLSFGDLDGDGVTFAFRRTDTGDSVEVTYHTSEIPDAGSAVQSLPKLIDGTATDEERAAFAEAWNGRVGAVLTDDSMFSFERTS